MRRVRLLPPALLLFLIPTSLSAQAADIVFQNGIVWTGTSQRGVTCVAVTGNRIVYAGDDAGAARLRGGDTRMIDLHGMLLLPGLVDAHAHLKNLGTLLGEVSLVGTRSAADVARLVREAQARHERGAWIHGRGWDQNDWSETAFPTWRDLPDSDGNPVYLDRIDGHAIWVNRAALDLCGITVRTADPPGGRIVRDADGEPTGVFIDNAEDLITSHVPAPSDAEVDAILRRAIVACNRAGLTGVHDAGSSPAVMASLRRLGAAGELTINVYAMVDSENPRAMRAALRAGPWEDFDGRLVVRCVKLRADGALGSRGAALLADYDDDPGNRGLLVTPPDSLLAWTVDAMRHGFQLATHAIGDRGNRVILDVYQQAMARVPAGDPRPRVEHCQVLAPEDLPRFARMGVVASMQPTHATSDMPWAQARIGAARLRGAYAWRTLAQSGAVLAFGSDAPVESIDPLWGIYAAVTRQDRAGLPQGGWMPEQCLTPAEAIRAFTWGAAYASFEEERTGSIRPGLRADLTVVDTDLLTCTPTAMRDAHAVMTVVQGKIVYQAGD